MLGALACAASPLVQEPNAHAVMTSRQGHVRARRKGPPRDLGLQLPLPLPKKVTADDHFHKPIRHRASPMRMMLMTTLRIILYSGRAVLIVIPKSRPPPNINGR